MHPINDNFYDKNEPDFDASLSEALKKAGLDFPETEEELDSILEKLRKMRTPQIPHGLDDPMAILKAGRLQIQSSVDESTDEEVEANLARAAREGGDIDNEVELQMKKDRKRADDELNDRTTS
jgi:hypothetical protein